MLGVVVQDIFGFLIKIDCWGSHGMTWTLPFCYIYRDDCEHSFSYILNRIEMKLARNV